MDGERQEAEFTKEDKETGEVVDVLSTTTLSQVHAPLETFHVVHFECVELIRCQ